MIENSYDNLKKMLNTIWDCIDSTKTESENEYIKMLVNKFSNFDIYAAKHTYSGNKALIFELNSFSIIKADIDKLPKSIGFECQILKNDLEALQFSIINKDVSFDDVFIYFCVNLMMSLDGKAFYNSREVYDFLVEKINKLKKFASNCKSHILSQKAEIGLFGELLFLKNMIDLKLPVDFILDSWKGPLKFNHDFMLGFCDIEVKTTNSKDALVFEIQSIEQLEEEDSPLFLLGIKIKTVEPTLGQSLPNLVDEIFKLLQTEKQKQLFTNLLASINYFDYYREKYISSYTFVSQFSYTVDDNFPRLKRNNLFSEIKKVNYQLDLTNYEGNKEDINNLIVRGK